MFKFLIVCIVCLQVMAVDLGSQFAWAQSDQIAGGSPTSRAATSEGRIATAEQGFVFLFNGHTMEGWEGNMDFFRVEDGAIVAGSLEKPIPNNEFLCTKKRYENFDLRLEVRLIGQGNNAGIQFRSERIPNDHEVSGYQCDMGMAWQRPVWGALYDESRRRKMLAEGPAEQVSKWLKEGDWNELRILAEGKHIRLYLNGHETIAYTENEEHIGLDGIIGLQIHSGPPTEAWYRMIRIRELPATDMAQSTKTKPTVSSEQQ
ncbi:MAG: DUF1080 domain-containing protein [Planctomycetales bacterium]|nr:DUF1080 domain-containing protein [Planctomycetales bacterium]